MLYPLSYGRMRYFEADFTLKLINLTKVLPFLLTNFFNRLIIHSAKSLVKANCCRLLKSWGNVRISIKSYLYAGADLPDLIFSPLHSLIP